ncbi:MAG: lysophospholipid acyltransferase family protein, partial [Eubacteriales bacterium]|nr:lysophospholipid acyltransferase family protein [Eubacteriales bacterium]
PIYFIAKKELFKNKFLAYLFNQAYVIPIQRQSADLGAIRKALATVKQGNVLGIFPEGSRYYGGDMQQAESGIALLAAMAKVPVIPCYIDRKMEKFNKANVYFFEPLQYQDITGANFNEQFMQRLKSFYADVVKMH